MNQPSIVGETTYRRRPGPFGPAWALLPKDQQLLVLPGDTPAHDALERMVDHGYSQVPIENADHQIIGVFTWKSFGKRVCDLRAASGTVKPLELFAREFLEPARFIDPELYIDTETDWSDIDYVLVGDESKLVGVLCISDALGRLNDYAEAFVVIYEIEHEIRDLVCDIYDAEELAEQLRSLNSSAREEIGQACDELAALQGKQTEPASKATLGRALRLLKRPTGLRQPESLEDLTFSQYKPLICSVENWFRFQPVFDTMRELVDADFDKINDLRNVVFHFRRAITASDTDRLRRFRDRLRYDRQLFSSQRKRIASLAS